MKKLSAFTIVVFIMLCSTLTGCKNFFAGGSFMEELDQAIAENMAPEVDIYITADEGTGSVLPSGIVTYKVGKTFKVSFTESKESQFLYWEVIHRETKETITDGIEIADKTNPDTKFTVLAAKPNMNIHAVCLERPSIAGFSPQYTDEGVSRDSSIVITFNKDLSEDNDFSTIEITSAGTSVVDCYEKPVLNNNILTYAAKTSNLVEAPNGFKEITVTIPEDIYYEEDGTKSIIGKKITSTFKINNSTNKKTEITYSVAADKGTVTPEGTKTYNLGDTINLKYSPNDGYVFTKWQILNGEGVAVEDSVINIANKESEETSLTILDSVKGISITPNCIELPRIVSMSPEYSDSGTNCDASIVIKFNKKMKATDLESFKNIEITDRNNNDLTEYYKNPEIEGADGKTLVIRTNPSKLLLESTETRTKDIVIKLNSSISDVEDNLTLEKYYGKDGYSNKYCVNSTRESSAPVLSEIKVAINSSDLNNADKLFRSYSGTREFYKQNRFSNNLAISCVASDNTGIGKIKIVAQPVSTVGGNSMEAASPVTILLDVTDTVSLGNNNFKCTAIYTGEELKNSVDGIYDFKIFVLDSAKNPSEASFNYLVIKDTSLLNSTWTMTNKRYANGSSISAADLWAGKTGTSTLMWTVTEDVYATYNSTTYKTEVKDLKYTLEWGITNNPYPHKVNLNYNDIYDSVTNQFVYNISIDDKYKDTLIKLSVTDEVDNTNVLDVAIPGVDKIVSLENGGATYTKYFVLEHSVPEGEQQSFRGSQLFQHKSDGYSELGSFFTTSKTKNPQNFENADYIYVQSFYKYENASDNKLIVTLYSSLSDGIDVAAAVSSSSIPAVYLYKPELKKGDSNELKFSAKLVNYESEYDYYLEYAFAGVDKTLQFGSGTNSYYIKANLEETSEKKPFNLSSGVKNYTIHNISAEFPVVDGDYKYIVRFIRVKNGKSSSNFMYSDIQKEDSKTYYTFTDSNNPYSFTAKDYDIYGPVMDDFDCISGHIRTMVVYDACNKLKPSSWNQNITEYTYLWLPYDNTTNENGQICSPNISLNTYDSYSNKVTYGSALPDKYDYATLEINTKDLIDGNKYMLYAKVYDNQNNAAILNGFSIVNMASLKNELTFVHNTNTKKVTFNIQDETVYDSKFYNNIKKLDNESKSLYITGFNSVNQTWKTSDYKHISRQNDSTEYEYSTNFPAQYIRVTASKYHSVELDTGDVYSIYYDSNPVYLYTGDTTCTCKNLTEGKGGISVICEEPTLFYICSSAVGYGDNQLEWERRGAHIRPTYTEKSMNVDTSNVTPGDYYVVIANFADGTSLMSDVYQK